MREFYGDVLGLTALPIKLSMTRNFVSFRPVLTQDWSSSSTSGTYAALRGTLATSSFPVSHS